MRQVIKDFLRGLFYIAMFLGACATLLLTTAALAWFTETYTALAVGIGIGLIILGVVFPLIWMFGRSVRQAGGFWKWCDLRLTWTHPYYEREE